MVIGIVMLLSEQYPWRGGQLLNQLRRSQAGTAAKIANQTQIRMLMPLWTLPRRQRRQWRLRLASAQQQQTTTEQNAHTNPLTNHDQWMVTLGMALHQHLQTEYRVKRIRLQHFIRRTYYVRATIGQQ